MEMNHTAYHTELAAMNKRIHDLEQQLAEAKAAQFAQESSGAGQNQGTPPAADTWQRFREAIDNLPEVMVIYDRDLRVRYINQATVKTTGRPVSDYIGKHESEIWPPEVYQTWYPALEAARDLGVIQSLDIEFQQSKDNKRYLHITCIPIKDLLGKVHEIVGMTEDLTERKLAEEARQETFTLLKGITNTSNNLVAAVDPDFRYTWFNPAYWQEFKQIFGVDLKLGDSLIEALSHLPEEQENAAALWRRALLGETISYTAEFGDYSRERKAYDMRFSPIYGPDGQISGAGEIASDVTQRVKAEQALQESEDRYRSLFTNMSEGFAMGEAILDENGEPKDFRFLAVNNAFESQTGLKPNIIGQPATKALPNLERFWIDTYCGVALSGQAVSFRRYNVDTNRYYAVYCFSPSAGMFAILFRDVTAEQEASEALQASEERLRLSVENLMDAFAIYSSIRDEKGEITDFRVEYVNQAACELTGRAPENYTGRTVLEMYPNLDKLEIFEWYVQAVEQGKTIIMENYPFDSSVDGKPGTRYYDYQISRLGEGFTASWRDVTERKQQISALRESEERFRFVIENSLDVAYRRNLQTDRYDYMSPVVEQVLGFTADEMNDLNMENVASRIHPDDIPIIETALVHARETGKGKLEYRFRHKDGEYRWMADYVTVVNDEMGVPMYRSGILRDITDRKKNEQALRELNETLEERVRERTEALQCEIEDRKQIESELVEMRKHSIDNVEEERLQIAQEVHDGPMQDLYALSYDIAGLDAGMAPEVAETVYSELQDRLLEINNSLRQISRGLRPPVLDQFGLEKAIQDHTGNILRDNRGLQVKLRLASDKDRLESRVRLALFRIYQTAMGNILRHSEASSVEVHLLLDEDANTVVLEVADNGKGFELPKRWINLVRAGHLGLAGANERAQNIGGKLSIETARGKGTLIRVIAPMQEKV